MLRAPRRPGGTYEVISGGLDEEDMVVAIGGQNFLVVLRPEPGMPCEAFGYQPGAELPDSVPAGVWDPGQQCVGLWDAYGDVVSWYAEAGSPTLRFDDLRDPDEPRRPNYRGRPRAMSPDSSRRVRAIRRAGSPHQRGGLWLSSNVDLADPIAEPEPIPDPEPALFTMSPHTVNALECYDLVLPLANGGSEIGNYVAPNRPSLNGNGIAWGVHKRSGRVYAHTVDESLLPTQAIPELAATHSRADTILGCYLLAVNRKSARLMTPDMIDALMHGADSDDTRRSGLELTFQSQPKFTQQEYLTPRLAFVGTISSGMNTGAPVQIRNKGKPLDVEICAAVYPDNRLTGTMYRVTEEVYLALRRRRMLFPTAQSSEHTPTQQEYQERWARSVRQLRKDRGAIEPAVRGDKYSYKGRDHELHFHGSREPGFLQCGGRRGRAQAGKTVSYRRRYAARHLKGRAFHTWESKTLYSIRVKRYCRHAEFRVIRQSFDYWLDVTLDWMKKASGGRRQLPPEEIHRRKQAAQLPPDTVRRLKAGAATQVAQGLSVWEYRLLSFYFDKLRRLYQDEMLRWMNSFRMRRVLEAWYTYATSNLARQTASGGMFGKVDVPKRAVGALRGLRSSQPGDWWNAPPDPLEQLEPHEDRLASRWDFSRLTSLMRIHRMLERRERPQPRRIAAVPLTLLSCGADDGGDAPLYAFQTQLRLGDSRSE